VESYFAAEALCVSSESVSFYVNETLLKKSLKAKS